MYMFHVYHCREMMFELLIAIKFSKHTTRDQMLFHEHTADMATEAFELQISTVE